MHRRVGLGRSTGECKLGRWGPRGNLALPPPIRITDCCGVDTFLTGVGISFLCLLHSSPNSHLSCLARRMVGRELLSSLSSRGLVFTTAGVLKFHNTRKAGPYLLGHCQARVRGFDDCFPTVTRSRRNHLGSRHSPSLSSLCSPMWSRTFCNRVPSPSNSREGTPENGGATVSHSIRSEDKPPPTCLSTNPSLLTVAFVHISLSIRTPAYRLSTGG